MGHKLQNDVRETRQPIQSGYVTDLPKLGVPKLEDTVAKLVHFAKPVLSAEDYAVTLKEADEFLQDPKSQKLQQLLEKRAQKLDNWLTPWWLSAAYLAGRTPLPIVTSPGLAVALQNFEGEGGQLEYAAKFVQVALDFKKMIDDKTLKQDGTPNVPFDMDQYENLFGTVRIPKPQMDQLRYGKDSPNHVTHIIVTRNGHSFKFPVYSKNGEPLGLQQLVRGFKDYVIPQSQERNSTPINLLSAADRETWAPVYKRLAKNNAAEIEALEDALFILCLDQSFPVPTGYNRKDDNMMNALHGGGSQKNSSNRWFDKCLNLYVDQAGGMGICYEHTPAEGPPVAGLLDYLQDRLRANQFNYITADAEHRPLRLNWRITELDRAAFEKTVPEIDATMQDVEIRSYHFTSFGKNFAKAAKLSPDSLIQMCMQIAYYRLHGALAPTYETATLRKFKQGRTDTIRLPNRESAEFVEQFARRERQLSDGDLAELLARACDEHKKYGALAMNGQAMDRHLLGLKMTATENDIPLPGLLKGRALQRLLRFQVSTSQVPTRNELNLGFGPSELDGYGICYNPNVSSIFFTISAYIQHPKTSAKRFTDELDKALQDVRELLQRSGRVTPEKSRL